MGEMIIPDPQKGDRRSGWDPYKQDEVDVAKKEFDKLVKEGYLAFRVKKGGEAGDQLREFDKYAEFIIYRKALAGG